VYTTFYLYLCVFYRCWISYKHVKLNWHKMPTKKKNNPENIRRNLVSNPSCRGQNKTIISTCLLRFNTLHCACSFNIYLLNINLRFRCSGWHVMLFYISRAWCKTIVTSYIKWGSYNSFAPSPRYRVRGCMCTMTSFLDSTHVNLPKNITGISVIDCDW